ELGGQLGSSLGVIALAGAPAAICALGFTSQGIAAGSLAAKMMSVTAVASGGGVPAGSVVALLQSAGAAGLSLASKVGLGSAAASLGATVGAAFSKK
uniref:Uncharacterized protein n=1 Tax=Nothoprocta perdicaria TaxID=30464 RepID=A0A8C6Z9L6_NOTPE